MSKRLKLYGDCSKRKSKKLTELTELIEVGKKLLKDLSTFKCSDR
jgi:hypothetical protein